MHPSHCTGRRKHLDWLEKVSGHGIASGWKWGCCPHEPGNFTALLSLLGNAPWVWWLPEPGSTEGSPVSILQGAGEWPGLAYSKAERGSVLPGSLLLWVWCPGVQTIQEADMHSGC